VLITADMASHTLPLPAARRLNPIHVAVVFRRLASITQAANQAQAEADPAAAPAGPTAECLELVHQLQGQLKQQRCNGYAPRGLANIMAALAKQQCLPDMELLPMLLDSFCSQLYDAVPEDIANVLWSAAQLTIAYGPSPVPAASGSKAGQGYREAEAVLAAAAASAPAAEQDTPAADEHMAAAAAAVGLPAETEVEAGETSGGVAAALSAGQAVAAAAAAGCSMASASSEGGACAAEAEQATGSVGDAADAAGAEQQPQGQGEEQQQEQLAQEQQQQQPLAKVRPPPLLHDPLACSR
jgi:hypothetical protein